MKLLWILDVLRPLWCTPLLLEFAIDFRSSIGWPTTNSGKHNSCRPRLKYQIFQTLMRNWLDGDKPLDECSELFAGRNDFFRAGVGQILGKIEGCSFSCVNMNINRIRVPMRTYVNDIWKGNIFRYRKFAPDEHLFLIFFGRRCWATGIGKIGGWSNGILFFRWALIGFEYLCVRN